jgi:hypothetical protein
MRRSYLIAGAIALLAAGWLASGMVLKPGEPASPGPAAAGANEAEAAQLSATPPGGGPPATGASPSEQPAPEPGAIVIVQVMT